jgi:hypothetical protein
MVQRGDGMILNAVAPMPAGATQCGRSFAAI